MPQAIDAKALKEADAEYQAKKKRKDVKETFAGKTFESMNAQEKDALLKELAVRAGLIDDSE